MAAVWAIIKTGAKQFKVEEGKTVIVEKLDGQKDTKITFDNVLIISGDKVSIGMPTVEKAKVTGKIVETFRDKKVRVVKFKSKSRYTRTTGHRQTKTKVLIEKIFV